MKKTITSILVLTLTATISFAQTLTKIYGSVEVDDRTINIGDKFIVYEPQNFQKTYESIYSNKRLSTKRSRFTQVDDKKYDYSLAKFSVVKIFKATDGRIILSDGGIFPNYIEIEAALKNGEVITEDELSKRYNQRELLDDSTAFIHFIKRFDGETNEFWKDWLYTYKNDVYDRTHEDEFEFYGVVNKAGEQLLEAAEKLDNTTIYSANIKVELDDYDFSSNSFKFLWKGGSFNIFRSPMWCKCTLDEINLELSNLSEFETLPVPFEQAKSFISNRKDRYGRVDRDVYLWVNLKLTNDLKYENGDAIMRGIVQSIEVYADENHTNGYLGTIKQ